MLVQTDSVCRDDLDADHDVVDHAERDEMGKINVDDNDDDDDDDDDDDGDEYDDDADDDARHKFGTKDLGHNGLLPTVNVTTCGHPSQLIVLMIVISPTSFSKLLVVLQCYYRYILYLPHLRRHQQRAGQARRLLGSLPSWPFLEEVRLGTGQISYADAVTGLYLPLGLYSLP